MSVLLLAVACTIITHCTYEPTEEFFKEIEQVTPQASIDLSSYNDKDTVVVSEPSNFRFRVAVTNPSIISEVEVLLDAKQIWTGQSVEGSFEISQSVVALGYHQLKVQFKALSNSGSLADHLGAEYFQAWRTWTIKVEHFDNAPPLSPELKISEQNGRLRLDWSKFSKKNFINYKLKVSSEVPREFFISDSLSTFWIDSGFVWGSASYELTVTNKYGSASTTTRIDQPQDFKVTYNANDSTAVLRWKPSRFYSAFGNVILSENSTVRETILKASDSVRSLKLKEVLWGRSESLMLQVVPKNTLYKAFESTQYILDPVTLRQVTGTPIFYYQNGIHKLMGHKPSYARLCFYDDQMRLFDSTALYASSISVPFSGSYFYYLNDNRVVRHDLISNEKVLSSDYNFYQIDQNSVQGTANGLVSYFSFNKQYAWDVRLGNAIQSTFDNTYMERTDVNYDPKLNLPPKSKVLSDDGRFAMSIYNRSVYSLQGNVQTIGTLPQIGAFYDFRPDNNDEIILTTTGSILILNSADLSVLRTISIPDGHSISGYDPLTHYAVCEKNSADRVYLVNIDNNDVKTVRAYSTGWRIINGFLFDGSGKYMKVL